MASPFDDPAGTSGPRQFGAGQEDDALDGEYSMIDDYPEELDYFALLGLPSHPTPSDAEIRSAYRTLTLSFHPDKQPPHLREAAQRHFTRIQEAYGTLSDPKKRAVYDILGAEGVRREWGRYGAMGAGGEAQRQQVGVRAMMPDEFRRWFLKTMKGRERKAVESLVESHGVLTLGIDASSTISVDEDGDVTFHVPSAQLRDFGARYSFKAPLPLPELFGAKEEGEGAEEQETDAGSNGFDEGEGPVEVRINAGILGTVFHPKQKYTVKYEDESTEEVEASMPPGLLARNLTLGASVTRDFRGMAGTKGLWNMPPFALVRDSTVIVEGLLLPVPALKTTVARSFQPIPGIKPFQVTATSTVQRSLWQTPPTFEVQTTKPIAKRKLAFLSWYSGLLGWPQSLLERFPSLGMEIGDASAAASDLSRIQVGILALPKQPQNVVEIDEDGDGESETENGMSVQKTIDRAAESWQAFITAAPGGGGIGFNYSRNLFSGKPADDPVKSEWNSEGYFPLPKMEEARAVRVQVSTTIDTGLSISWSVKGTRRVGEHTKMGLGVGISPQGIMATVSWSRLGQGINIPMIICPADEANHDATVLAALFPWLTYCAIEFGYIRPRNRRKRRQAAARRHKELKKLIPKQRAESEQAIQLMFDQVQRRQAREAAQNGLVITKAEYGYIPPKNKKPKNGFTDPRVIDVTVPVAALVDRSQLVLPKTVKFKIIGFHDPAPLLPKRLKIWYTFQGRDHFVEVGDNEGVACPVRTHLIST